MKYFMGLALGSMFALNAQNPLSTEAQQAWTRTMGNVVAIAEKMPEEHYNFKPSPESMSFRDLVARQNAH